MLLGIKLSNLTRDQKILKVKKIFLPNFAEYLSSSTRQKKICREPGSRHSAKYPLCRVPGGGTRQRLDAISPPNGRRTAGARAGHVRRICRVPFVADSRHSAKLGHAVWQMFTECSCPGTRQSTSLPSVRVLVLGKGQDTPANLGFPVVSAKESC